MASRQGSELSRYLRTQREIAERLIASETLDEVAADFLAAVARLLGWEAGALWEVAGHETALQFIAGWRGPGSGEPPPEPRRGPRLERGAGLPGRAWEEGRIVVSTDLPGTDGDEGPAPAAALAIPIPIGPPDDVLAVAEFEADHRVDPQSEEELALLAGFANQLAAFISSRRDREEAERVRRHMAEVVRGTRDAVLSKDLNGVVTSWNPAAERLYGYTAAEAIGRHVSFLVPPDRKNEEMMILERVMAGERLDTYETERIRRDGARISVALTVSEIHSPRRGIVGASVIARDITAELRRRRARDFLVAAGRLLDRSLDPVETARTIVDAAVPELAEICVIDFIRPDGWYGDSIAAGADPEAAARLERIRRESPLDPRGRHPVAQVLRERRPMIWRDLTAPDVIADVAQNEDHRQLIRDAGYTSAAVVPLIARGRRLGGMSFLHAAGDLRYDAADLDFLAELGDRAAMALDNARLYSERDRIAANLQRGLRPPSPPRVRGLEVAVAFEAAGDGIEIGGDLYDVIEAEEGCWVLIGDVAGKGSAAAGVSVAVRHSVRGLSREIDDPVDVLARVNELLVDGTSLHDFATAMLLRLRRDGDAWSYELAAAGHPPAILAGAGGTRLLGGGSVLGAWRRASLGRHAGRIAPGETLILYSDGWLEAGPVDAHAAPEALAALVGRLAGLRPAELIERLRYDAVRRGGGALRDDLVLLALRPTAPAEAGRRIGV